jgi:glycosyltransferase involved in cell wall biosynthesis
MKLAWFSPMPPARTGIATYSHELLPALRAHFDITVFAPYAGCGVLGDVRVVDFASRPAVLKQLPAFDRIVYHLGNNPWFHLDIFRVFLLHPAPVVLHDTVLYYLAAGAGRGGLLRELDADPRCALGQLKHICAESPDGDLLRLSTPSKYPCLTRVLAMAPMLMVHNHAAAQVVARQGYRGRTVVIAMPHYSRARMPQDAVLESLRHAYGFTTTDILFGAFGFIGPTKRLDKVLEAFRDVVARGNAANARLLIVGEGSDLSPLIRAHGLAERVRTIGYVSEEQFRDLIDIVDVVVNLRYPSHGESSATLMQAMSRGKPCLVTDDASFSELPDEAVWKISFGASELDEIVGAVERLANDSHARSRLGRAAEAHVRVHHGIGAVANRYREALGVDSSHGLQERHENRPSGTCLDYFSTRLQELIP